MHRTTVDLDWVWDYIHLASEDKTRRLDLGVLRNEVESWYSTESLTEIMGPVSSETEQIAREWLQRAGKRWRPFLTVAAFQALRDTPEAPLPRDIRKIAVAVECFHKASLVHDAIEDQDTERYGRAFTRVWRACGVECRRFARWRGIVCLRNPR